MPFPNKATLLQRFIASRQLIPGDWANGVVDSQYSFQALTPAGAATQVGATLINSSNVEILAGSAASAVKLPPSYPGAEVSILNNSANSQQVFGTGSDVVQSGTSPGTFAAAATGVTLTTLNSAIYFCIKIGFWQRAATA